MDVYTDNTGTDLMQFVTHTLQNNPKDRVHLLKVEKQLTDLIKDGTRNQHNFGPMSSYHRMLVHRVAALFGMDHNVNSIDNSVLVSKSRTSRLPEFKFNEQINSFPDQESNEPVKFIIKRDSASLDKLSEKGLSENLTDSRSNTLHLVDSRRSKSLKEREEEYEKTRARIFNQDSTSSSDNPSDACANTSTADDSMATSSSGIVVSTSATNSSPSCSHEDLKPTSNHPHRPNDSGLWSSTESEGSNRPRYLRLQRQKRLPDSFDSDSARTSFTTSSSVSSASGMFLTPDSCLIDSQLGFDPSSNNRLTFTKASSFGGISVLTRDNEGTSSPASEPRLTKTASLNTPKFSDKSPRSSSKHESLTVFPQPDGSQQLHLWPKKQSKSNVTYSQYGNPNNSGSSNNHISQDQGNRNSSSKSSHLVGRKLGDKVKTTMEPPLESIRNTSSFDSSTIKCNSNRETNYRRSASETSSTSNHNSRQWISNHNHHYHHPAVQSSPLKGQSKHDSHNYGLNSVSRNQSSSSDRPKNFNPKDALKTQIGPQIIINSVGAACTSQIINKSSVIAADISSNQPYYHYPYIQATPPVVVEPPNMMNPEDSLFKIQLPNKPPSEHLLSQMAGLSFSNSQSRTRSLNDHYSSLNPLSSGRNHNGHNPIHFANPLASGDLGMVNDLGYPTSGYPFPANLHAQKPVIPINTVSTAPTIPLCYIHPSFTASPQATLSHHPNRFIPGVNQPPGSHRLDENPNSYPTTDHYMTNLSIGVGNSHPTTTNQPMGRPPDAYSTNLAPELEIIRQTPQPKSNLFIMGSPQIPVNTSSYGSYQPIPFQQSQFRVVPQVQSLSLPSFQNQNQQQQLNRMPNVPYNPTVALRGGVISSSVPSSGPDATIGVGQVSIIPTSGPQISATSQQATLDCANPELLSPSQTYPYAMNIVSLANGGQLPTAPTNLTYAPSMEVAPSIPVYINTNGNNFAPNQLTGARPMPAPHQAQMIPSPYSQQNPLYRPVPLFFVFNFQNKRSN